MIENLKRLQTNTEKLLAELSSLRAENDNLRSELNTLKNELENQSKGTSSLIMPEDRESIKTKIEENIQQIDHYIEYLSDK